LFNHACNRISRVSPCRATAYLVFGV
jgi:hypothetical protein